MEQVSAAKKQPLVTSFYYGWVIVAIAGLGVFFSGPGQTYSISVFIDHYIKDFAWSRSLVSSIYSAATLLAGILMFFVGRFIDKHGQRKMTVIVGFALAVACIWNSFVANAVMLFIGFFFIRLFGQGSMTLIPTTLVPQWFISKRGRALSFMAIGGFLSSAALPPLNAWMISIWGWEITWRVWGILLLFIFVPLAYLLIRNKPEDIGLLPDGRKELQTEASTNSPVIEEENWTLQEAMKTRTFWLLLFCISIPSLVNTGLTFHLVSILGENNISPTFAAIILSLMALVGFPVTLVAGFVLEKVKVHYVLATIFVGEILFILILLKAFSPTIAILFGVFWGIIGGFERITLGIIWPNYFGRKHLGSIKGTAMTITVIGSAFGPLPFGIAFDLFGGYNEILLIMMILPTLGVIAALFAIVPKKENVRLVD
ncbi:MFS transporter [Litchfieldia salsa]|uniref:Sugar phosphate permease n=1 Tax=Litchfieldia salsa TaxID=930152 RepID=A0A1H0WCM8_9BACI|nr:MFS transporter [Litchfieldia salsa]SDP88510.1 Sugar phosphate permease [Litchfieldia salsa]